MMNSLTAMVRSLNEGDYRLDGQEKEDAWK